MSDNFFTEQKEQSLIKARIVEKYFWVWANVVIPTAKQISPKNPRIAYIDLFAGPGRYEDGSKSTPNQKSSAPRGGVWKTFCSQTLGFHCKLIFSAPRGGELHPNYY
jgi:hypothetical protein